MRKTLRQPAKWHEPNEFSDGAWHGLRRERRGARAGWGSLVLGGWQGVKACLPCADSGAVGCLPAQAANALAEVEGGSPAAVVFCPGLRWIRSLLIALSVIKTQLVEVMKKDLTVQGEVAPRRWLVQGLRGAACMGHGRRPRPAARTHARTGLGIAWEKHHVSS